MTHHYLACDLGATSGRLMLGSLTDGKIALEELHRFQNDLVKSGPSLHWNMEALFKELKTGLKKAAARNVPLSSLSTDSWGVDYLLFDAEDQLIEPTFAYRDPRTERGVRLARERVSWETIYSETGIQFMPLNTIYQLAAESPDRLARAKKLLLIGDAFNYYCSGIAVHEESLASTSQLYNPQTRAWSSTLLDSLNLPNCLFTTIAPAGTRLGPLRPELAVEVGLPRIDVIASCSHDTGAAVAAVPGRGEHWAYLSSGTWSLMGVELQKPILTEPARELNYTNEIGFGGTIRFLKNIVGMWIIEECRREWAQRGHTYDQEDLVTLANKEKPFVSLINPNDPRFLAPDQMPEKIAKFCEETRQTVPTTAGAILRCAFESLALCYRRVALQIEGLTRRKIEQLHVVGGGSRNALLNQFTANALQLPVLAGPTECAALGNVLVQAIAMGHLPSLADARETVRRSFELTRFEPRGGSEWDAASKRFEMCYS